MKPSSPPPPHVSVVIATYRPGGAVIPLRALACQTFKDFEVVVVTEIGPKAWIIGDLPINGVRVVELRGTSYHSPTHALNAGIDAARGEIVALLADFAYPDKDWLKTLVDVLLQTKTPFVGGTKCPHGTANNETCTPGAVAQSSCPNHPLLPVLAAMGPDRAMIYPCQGAFNLGNCAFWRRDAQAVNGLEERFSGCHGFEDENFVRRLVASKKTQALLAKKAVIHHYWPYASGYKPTLAEPKRPWAFGLSNQQLDRFLLEAETLVGNYVAQRVPVIQVKETGDLVSRSPAAVFVDGLAGSDPYLVPGVNQ